MKKAAIPLLAGLILGAVLATGSFANAVEAFLKAYPSTHVICLDGKKIEVEAYVINGSNYVRLRDIGEAMDFNVYWNDIARTVEIETDMPYMAELAEPVGAGGRDPAGTDWDAIREDIVERTNAFRIENGLPTLTMSDDLMAAAQVRATEAAATISYSHSRPDGSDNDTVVLHTGTLFMGENMGMKDLGNNPPETLSEIQIQSWEDSPGHRRNMLNPVYHSTGVGVAQDLYGMYYMVQVFTGGDYTITGIDDPILP